MSTNTIILIILLAMIILPYFWVFTISKKRKETAAKLEIAQNDALALRAKLKPITDMELAANQIKSAAEQYSAVLKSEAEQYASELKNEADSLIANAKETVHSAHNQARKIEKQTQQESENIITLATQQAADILAIRDKATLYESTVEAMRNAINGYKDEYIIPNISVLDDLAEQFSHKEAGEHLKSARQHVRLMIKQQLAGECDYAEQNRRNYAIIFAVDAFNGKVDSALAKVKHDNFGKIQQEIKDAFALVNHNGSPFRNARITKGFLNARLNELKWAVAANELQRQEREEQKAIREQMRDEERAQREIEKAIQAAQKEERLLQTALEKARKELATASDEQKLQFEAQLAELEEKLKEAESRGIRAMSMAQQTRRGHVYVISNIGSFGEQVFKVGMTRRLDPLDRVKELGDASVPFEFDIHAMIYSDDAPTLEKQLHREFEQKSVNRVNPRKEFFRLPLVEIRHAVEKLELSEVHWTMKAEATEYLESLSIYHKESSLGAKHLVNEKELLLAI